MTALDSMIRVHGWILEEKRRNLAEIQAFADKLKADLATLDRGGDEGRVGQAQLWSQRITKITSLDRIKKMDSHSSGEKVPPLSRPTFLVLFTQGQVTNLGLSSANEYFVAVKPRPIAYNTSLNGLRDH